MKDISKLRIETKRLYLRPVEADDFQDLCRLDRDPEVRSFFPEGALTVEQVQRELTRFIQEWQTIGFGMFVAIEKNSDTWIGRCGYAQLKSGEVELGYLLLKEYWGQGYATECAMALLEWGTDNLPVDRVTGFAPSHHFASLRILEKCGMQYVKTDYYQNIESIFYHYYFKNRGISQSQEKI